MGPRRRWRVALAVPALGLLAGACSGTRVDERNAAGRLEVGDLVQADLADVECAEPGGTLFAAGVAVGDDGELTVVDLEVTEGEVLATVRTSRGDDVVGQQVGQDLTATRDGDQLEVAGTFVVYDGAVQSGEVAGEVTLTCEPDTDPGGGFLVVDGTEVPYDLVTCVETDESFEARGRATTDAAQTVAVRRVLLRSGWVDRIDVAGDISVGTDASTEDEATSPVDVAGGLFTVRGDRVTAEGDVFGDGRLGSLELTCGIDLVAGDS